MKYQVAIIGLGVRAVEEHIPSIQSSRLAQLTAICDIDNAKVQMWASRLGVNGYSDYEELLNSEELDFIIVSAPHGVHASIVELSAKRGIHILKEKPVARNLDEALRMKTVCDKNNIHLMVAMQKRLMPVYLEFLKIRNTIGSVFFVECRHALYFEKIEKNWRANKESAGGGVILDLGYHMIDLIIWYFGFPDEVFSQFSDTADPNQSYEVEDTATIIFKYHSGLHGSITLSRRFLFQGDYMRINGNRGAIELEKEDLRIIDDKESIKSYSSKDLIAFYPTTNQIDNFCRVLSSEITNIGSISTHLQHMAFIEGCYQSGISGQYVNIKDLLQI